MIKIRAALNLLDQRTLVQLAESRGVRGGRSNDERREALARSYRGNGNALVAELSRADLQMILRELELTSRADRISTRSRDELAAILLASFDEGSPVSGGGARPSKEREKVQPLAPFLDEIMPSWLARLDSPPGSRDPLGLQTISAKHADELLPGLTVFTSRARYYGFLCWAVATAQQDPTPAFHLERVHRLERLLVLGEALRHGDDARACTYIGGRRGRAFARESAAAGLMSLPSKVLKNQTSNGALRLYRTSLVDVGLVEENDISDGLGLELTERGRRLAESYGEEIDSSVVAWALSGSDQRKRRDAIELAADEMCLSNEADRRERTLVFDALFARRVETATPSALRRRMTAYWLLRQGILKRRAEQEDIVADDADAISEDGGRKAAAAETRGNWSVVRALLEHAPKAEISDLQTAAAYQVLALALNQIFRSLVEVATSAGRVLLEQYLDLVGERLGAGFDTAVGTGAATTPSELALGAEACISAENQWPTIGATGVSLLVDTLRCDTVMRWLVEVARDDSFVGEVLERARVLDTMSRRTLLRGLVVDMLVRHRAESARKGKGEWIAFEDGAIVRVDPRELLPIIHSLRFAQLEQLITDLEVDVDEVADVA